MWRPAPAANRGRPVRTMAEPQLYDWLMITWLVLAGITFVSLQFVTAPYGRFTRKGWGPSIGRTPGWVLMESPAVWTMVVLFAIGDRTRNVVAIVFLGLWLVHYVYRTYLFPFRMRGEKKRMTLVTVLLAIVFNLGNGYLNGRWLFGLGEVRDASWFTDPRFLVGVALFGVGLAINIHSDAVLRSLRKPGETGYKIPDRGMFRRVSAANYFGELVEWTGWAIATWSPGALVFLIWTAANLVPRARSHHRWYRETFPDYPKERKAVIPFIY